MTDDTYRDVQTQCVAVVTTLEGKQRHYPNAPIDGGDLPPDVLWGTGEEGRYRIYWYYENTTGERALELALMGCAARCIWPLALEVKPA